MSRRKRKNSMRHARVVYVEPLRTTYCTLQQAQQTLEKMLTRTALWLKASSLDSFAQTNNNVPAIL